MGPLLCVLGDFALQDRQLPLPARSGGARLLAYLAVRGGPVPRAHLAGDLWGLGTAQRASSNLRAALCRLPRPGGRPLVTASAQHLCLADDVVVDLASARAAMAVVLAGPAPAAVAAELRSDLLPGWDEDWLVVEREHHRQLRLHALEASSDRC